jgi:hypothetical protein
MTLALPPLSGLNLLGIMQSRRKAAHRALSHPVKQLLEELEEVV